MRLFISLLLLILSASTLAAPKADLWPYWQQYATTNSQTVDHSRWQRLLDKYLVVQPNQTLFRYNRVSDGDKYELNRYLRDLSKLDPHQLNRNEQFAYWVNLYNAQTVKLILDNYPVSSITKLGGFFSFGPWDEQVLTINGKRLSLNDIEHRILRPIWRDPRIHYAVNCASLGCPDLQPEVFTASNRERLLDRAATRFINSRKGVNPQDDNTQLSSIYDWYGSDFGSTSQLQKHINQYRQGAPITLGRVSYDYDWSLNEAK
ncbi:hypothetical protein RJ45_00675 [Photobacterium gaetbulicola]|uniref:DUF547 domain-containing protein n=1 Tax=Photobacterium gaetbulicola TaxID=1295392 RepID=A0A0B9G9W0_9GAMM|nr:DUF547 domain-containing protein [Photobacterium gaetbulicola]KHT65528.1 hypothetical protein RJ45_00675 [Photobacterium gaetbulicola]